MTSLSICLSGYLHDGCSRLNSRKWRGPHAVDWARLVLAGMAWSTQPHSTRCSSTRVLAQAYIHDWGTRENRQAQSHKSYLSLCYVTLANIPLAQGSHMAEHRAKGAGTLPCPKWETTAKLHGPIMCLRRGHKLESSLKSTASIIWRGKCKIQMLISNETRKSLKKVKDYVRGLDY